MRKRVRAGLFCALLASLLILPTGCLTTGTIERAQPYNCKYGKLTQVSRAALTPKALYVEFYELSPDRRTASPRVLRIPLNDSSWLHDKRGRPVTTDGTFLSDTQVHHVARWFLLPGDAIPAEAEELPVFRVKTDNLEDLPREAHEVDVNVQVLSVSYSWFNTDRPWTDPLIAILSRPGPKGWKTALIITDVHEGCEQDRGWYAFTPLAVLGDAVTLPLQVLGVVLLDILWIE